MKMKTYVIILSKVFPVYHPGANSQMNRTYDQQLEDWRRIFEYYERVK